MRRRRAHISFFLLFCFLIGGVGGPLVHLSIRDVAEPSPHAPHSQFASEAPFSDFSPSHTICSHVQDKNLDCLLCNTLVLDLSPELAFTSIIRPLVSLALKPSHESPHPSFSFQLIRAPPLFLR